MMYLRSGLSYLRRGAIFGIMTHLLTSIILAYFLVDPRNLLVDIRKILPQTILLVSIPFLSFLLLFIKAASLLRRFDVRLGIGRAGLFLELIGLLIILLWIFTSPVSDSRTEFISWILTFLPLFFGALLLFLGGLGFSMMVMMLGEIEGLEEGFRLAGIIYMAGIFFSLTIPIAGQAMNLLSMILIYVYSRRSLRSKFN